MKKVTGLGRRKGSAVVIAVVMAILLVVIAGAGLSLVTTNRRVTDAHFRQHALLPAAERGLDQAMKVVNKYLKDNPPKADGTLGSEGVSASWAADGWTSFVNADAKLTSVAPSYAYCKDLGTLPLGDGRTCRLKVKVLNIPRIGTPFPYQTYAVAEVTGPDYSRQFLAAFRATSTQAPGMLSMHTLDFTGGNVFVAAYDSTKGAPNALYTDSAGVSHKNLSSDVTVATFYATNFTLGQVNIYGFVSTVPSVEATFAKNAHIWDVDSSAYYQTQGVDGYDESGNLYDAKNPPPTGRNPTPNIMNNFTLNPDDFQIKDTGDILDAVKANTGYTGTTLPAKTAANTVTANNQGEISVGGTQVTTLDAASVPGGVFYMDSSIGFKSSSPTLVIKGAVTLINNNGSNSFTASGTGNLLIKTASDSLGVYTAGDVTVGGNAIMGATSTSTLVRPNQLLIAGTNPTKGAQSITFNGQGSFIGMIYAPNATLALKGGGSTGTVQGSIVAYTISANGVTNFYFDKNLSSSTTVRYRLASITELTGAKKVSMSPL